MEATLYHICPEQGWERAQADGEYRAASLEAEGFIHCSRAEQVAGSANLFFAGHTDLVLLHINRARIAAPVRDETIADGRTFTHIYGPLNLDAVVDVQPFAPGPDGQFAFPA